MKRIDWTKNPVGKLARWMTCLICCLPLIGAAEDNKMVDEAYRRGAQATKKTEQRLAAIMIPHVKLDHVSIDEAIASLEKELSAPGRQVPTSVGPLKFRVMRSYGFQPGSVTLELKNASAATVIDQIADRAGMMAKVSLTGVHIWPKPEAAAKAKAAAFEAARLNVEAGLSPSGNPWTYDGTPASSLLTGISHRLDAVFSWIGSTTIRATLLAAVIVGLQLLLGRLIPPRWRYALWAPLLLVLVLPVLPKVPFGLFAEKPAIPAVVALPSSAPAMELPASALTAVVPSIPKSPLWKVNPLAMIWLSGVAALLALGVASYRRNLRRIMESRVEPDGALLQAIERAAREVRLAKVPRVIVSTAVPSPAVTGLLRPSLLLPADFTRTFNDAEVRLILVHELTHLKRHDLPVNWLCCVVQALHWFNPILWFAFTRMRDDREAACDAQVLSLDGKDHRSAYGHALLKLQSASTSPALHLGFVGIFERNAGLKSRIREISRHRAAHPAWHAVSVGLIALLFTFGATKAQEPRKPEQAAPEEAEAMDPEQVAIEKKLDTILIPVVDFEDTSLEEAIDFIRLRSKDLDKSEADAAKKGVNFVIRQPRGAAGGADPGHRRIKSLKLKNVTLRQALGQVAASTEMRFVVDGFAVTFVPADSADVPGGAPAPGKAKAPGKALVDASKIIIPVLDFQDTTLEEGIDFLRLRADQLSPDKKGVNIVLGPKADKDAVIKQLSLRNVPLSEAVRYIAEAVKQPLSADDVVIRIGE